MYKCPIEEGDPYTALMIHITCLILVNQQVCLDINPNYNQPGPSSVTTSMKVLPGCNTYSDEVIQTMFHTHNLLVISEPPGLPFTEVMIQSHLGCDVRVPHHVYSEIDLNPIYDCFFY